MSSRGGSLRQALDLRSLHMQAKCVCRCLALFPGFWISLVRAGELHDKRKMDMRLHARQQCIFNLFLLSILF